MQEFYLVSTELREPYKPRACSVLRRLHSETRDDLALVEVKPPLDRDVYHTREEIRYLILASRHHGATLFPVHEWPVAVYICLPKVEMFPNTEMIPAESLRILDWGEVREGGV